MAGSQSSRGKAFEYACLNSLYENLKGMQEILVQKTPALIVAENSYIDESDNLKLNMDLAANAATKILLKLEPQLSNPIDNSPLILSIQEDAAGIKGDVRDVISARTQNGWEVGISCKHNHSAVKHSRLSQTIDFGQSWFDVPCTEKYSMERNRQ